MNGSREKPDLTAIELLLMIIEVGNSCVHMCVSKTKTVLKGKNII